MHSAARPLLLPNAWDAATARIVEQCGFPAIATTSAGIAFAMGYADGQKISLDLMMSAVSRIVQAVQVPVTADVEAAYGDTPEDASRTARAAIEAGAVGINFEDTTSDVTGPLIEIDLQIERIRAIRQTASQLGVPLVMNARTDVYLLEVGDPAGRYEHSVRRLRAYRDSGADCVFVPGLRDLQTIGRMVKELGCPVNVLAVPGAPSVAELAAVGVKRISLGSGPMRAALGLVRRMASELREQGTYSALAEAPPYAEVNKLMSSGKS